MKSLEIFEIKNQNNEKTSESHEAKFAKGYRSEIARNLWKTKKELGLEATKSLLNKLKEEKLFQETEGLTWALSGRHNEQDNLDERKNEVGKEVWHNIIHGESLNHLLGGNEEEFDNKFGEIYSEAAVFKKSIEEGNKNAEQLKFKEINDLKTKLAKVVQQIESNRQERERLQSFLDFDSKLLKEGFEENSNREFIDSELQEMMNVLLSKKSVLTYLKQALQCEDSDQVKRFKLASKINDKLKEKNELTTALESQKGNLSKKILATKNYSFIDEKIEAVSLQYKQNINENLQEKINKLEGMQDMPEICKIDKRFASLQNLIWGLISSKDSLDFYSSFTTSMSQKTEAREKDYDYERLDTKLNIIKNIIQGINNLRKKKIELGKIDFSELSTSKAEKTILEIRNTEEKLASLPKQLERFEEELPAYFFKVSKKFDKEAEISGMQELMGDFEKIKSDLENLAQEVFGCSIDDLENINAEGIIGKSRKEIIGGKVMEIMKKETSKGSSDFTIKNELNKKGGETITILANWYATSFCEKNRASTDELKRDFKDLIKSTLPLMKDVIGFDFGEVPYPRGIGAWNERLEFDYPKKETIWINIPKNINLEEINELLKEYYNGNHKTGAKNDRDCDHCYCSLSFEAKVDGLTTKKIKNRRNSNP